MKKVFSMLTVLAFLSIPMQGAFAWTYDGPNSLNPFTGFQQCNKCVKVKKEKCKRQRLTKCQRLHGMKRGEVAGCAAPIQMSCPKCKKAF